MRRVSVWVLTCLSICSTWTAVQAQKPVIDPYDWPYWRGPEMNSISREKNLPAKWSPDGENLLWRKEELGTRSTPIVLGGKMYTICRHKPETTEEQEKVVCADLDTGKILWEQANNVFLSDAPAERVGWNSVVGDPETGNIYFLGLCGTFRALDGATGKILWERSMLEEYGLLSTYGGRTNYPFVFEDIVIVSGVCTGWGDYAVPAHRLMAFDKVTGQAVWIASTRLRPPDTTYSAPVMGVFNGERAICFGASDGAIYALQPRTGKEIWHYDASIRGVNVSPTIVGNKVFASHSEETVKDNSISGAIFCIDGTQRGEIKTELFNSMRRGVGRCGPLVINDRYYGVEDGGTLLVLDANTGKDIGKQKLGTINFGTLVYGDGKIYAGENGGRIYILEPSDKGVKVLSRNVLQGEEVHGSFIISHGKVLFPTSNAMYCLSLKETKPSADPIPATEEESPSSADAKPAHAQLVPAESLLRPGNKQKFQVRLYNAKGRYLKTVPAKITVKGPGSITEEGLYEVPKEAGHEAVFLTAEVDGLTSQARVRIVPSLPWSFDFKDGQVPLTWIGARYRHQIREVDGAPKMVKISTIPLGTRSQCFFGQPDLKDYTVEANVWGDLKDEKQPDIGVVNSRYTMDLMGVKQQIQIRSWNPRLELRFAKSVPFAWKPKTWYTVKFQSEAKPDGITLRGKVWPKGDEEPKEWQIEATDKTPNLTGSPGLFGRSSEAEILIESVKVSANK